MSTPIAEVADKALAEIRKAQAEDEAKYAEASQLVRQAAQQHADGDLDGARDTAMDAGDLLHRWFGDSDTVSDLEEALWEGDDDAWEERKDERWKTDVSE